MLFKNGHHVHAYAFNGSSVSKGYWRDVGTLDSYYQANMELTASEPKLDIFDPEMANLDLPVAITASQI